VKDLLHAFQPNLVEIVPMCENFLSIQNLLHEKLQQSASHARTALQPLHIIAMTSVMLPVAAKFHVERALQDAVLQCSQVLSCVLGTAGPSEASKYCSVDVVVGHNFHR